jgi:hypothetical protein
MNTETDFTPLIGRQITFLAPQVRDGENGRPEFRQARLAGKVLGEDPAERVVYIDVGAAASGPALPPPPDAETTSYKEWLAFKAARARARSAEGSAFRFEDVTLLEVDGVPYSELQAALAATAPKGPPPPPPVRWSPVAKAVMDFASGEVNEDLTNFARAELKLPVPWKREMLAAESKGQFLLIPPELAAAIDAKRAAA